jgi:hypothetical protein
MISTPYQRNIQKMIKTMVRVYKAEQESNDDGQLNEYVIPIKQHGAGIDKNKL